MRQVPTTTVKVINTQLNRLCHVINMRCNFHQTNRFKTFFVLNSNEQEFSDAHTYKNAVKIKDLSD